MKQCLKCHKQYNDDFDYCTICGSKLESVTLKHKILSNKNIYAIIACCLLLACGIGYTIYENTKFSNMKQTMQTDQVNKEMENLASKPLTSDLEIESGWKWRVDGDYIYIDGSVKNISGKTINYFEIGANFLNSDGNVLDSDYANDAQPLLPDTSRKFEIMHKNDSNYNKVSLCIQKVS
ncbi:MAG: FxLYD domain-containing protein [Oscillospiraceae bacterium]|jgi:hypothetical protein|nr:FxLYD domain-containing protein [Oscillospiraceae bacterium]